MNYCIQQKKPELIHRCKHVRGNINIDSVTDICDILEFEDMGSNEFERGNKIDSFNRMVVNYDLYKLFVFPEYRDNENRPLVVYAPAVYFKNAKDIVDSLVVSDKGLKKPAGLCTKIKNGNEQPIESYDADFWWDIENDLFMTFEYPERIHRVMNNARTQQIAYAKWLGQRLPTKDCLLKIYIKDILKPYWRPSNFRKKAIKGHQYDSANKTYYVEYAANASLDDIFMEAIVLAKSAKASVVFDAQGESFVIDEKTVPDVKINENGTTMIDSRTYTQRVEEFKQQREEAIGQRETTQAQRRLVLVLKQIKNKVENEKDADK